MCEKRDEHPGSPQLKGLPTRPAAGPEGRTSELAEYLSEVSTSAVAMSAYGGVEAPEAGDDTELAAVAGEDAKSILGRAGSGDPPPPSTVDQ
jgi:hypothetical protein